MTDMDELFQNQMLELRRGSIVLAIVSVLHQGDHYGYSLLKELEGLAFPVEGNTLYPLLRRLEKQEVLESTWDTSDTRPRKYYRLTPAGKILYKRLLAEWLDMTKKMNHMIKEDI